MNPHPFAAYLARALLTSALVGFSATAGAQTSIKFAAFGDYGDGPGTAAVAKLVSSQAPDFIVTVGDNCYGSTPISTQVGTHFGTWVASGSFYPSLGNHDYSDKCGGGSGASGYLAYFDLPGNERYYQVSKGPVEIFAVNSPSAEPDGTWKSETQAQWLKGALAASTAPWKVVYFHHAPFSSGDTHGSARRLQWPFELWGADAVLAGHDHHYERLLRDDDNNGVKMPYFITGIGGQSIRPANREDPGGSVIKYWADYGALFATATETSLSFEFRSTNGTLVDSHLMTKSGAETSPETDPEPTRPGKKPPKKSSTSDALEPRACC